MKKLKALVALSLTIATLGIVTSCSGTNTKEETVKVETRIVKTVKGEVEIPTNPQRIVDISGNSEELVLLGYTPVGT